LSSQQAAVSSQWVFIRKVFSFPLDRGRNHLNAQWFIFFDYFFQKTENHSPREHRHLALFLRLGSRFANICYGWGKRIGDGDLPNKKSPRPVRPGRGLG
jgi:hypothetical protein